MDQKRPAIEVILRNPLHADDEGVSVAPRKGLMSSKVFFKQERFNLPMDDKCYGERTCVGGRLYTSPRLVARPPPCLASPRPGRISPREADDTCTSSVRQVSSVWPPARET